MSLKVNNGGGAMLTKKVADYGSLICMIGFFVSLFLNSWKFMGIMIMFFVFLLHVATSLSSPTAQLPAVNVSELLEALKGNE